MTHRGPFQPRAFCDSVKYYCKLSVSFAKGNHFFCLFHYEPVHTLRAPSVASLFPPSTLNWFQTLPTCSLPPSLAGMGLGSRRWLQSSAADTGCHHCTAQTSPKAAGLDSPCLILGKKALSPICPPQAGDFFPQKLQYPSGFVLPVASKQAGGNPPDPSKNPVCAGVVAGNAEPSAGWIPGRRRDCCAQGDRVWVINFADGWQKLRFVLG